MPDYQTITPPFWRGWIQIECADGKNFKYVRNITKRALKGTVAPWSSDSVSFDYIWGDSIGDTIGATGDTVGRILFDFQRICSNFNYQATTAGAFLKFPEYGYGTGDTAFFRRINKEQLQPISAATPNDAQLYTIPGDTLGYRLYNLQAYTITRIVVSQVQNISLIQERISLWYKNQQSYLTGVPGGTGPFANMR